VPTHGNATDDCFPEEMRKRFLLDGE